MDHWQAVETFNRLAGPKRRYDEGWLDTAARMEESGELTDELKQALDVLWQEAVADMQSLASLAVNSGHA